MNEWCLLEPTEHATLHDAEFIKFIPVYYMSEYILGTPSISNIDLTHLEKCVFIIRKIHFKVLLINPISVYITQEHTEFSICLPMFNTKH
jgi:hypothetical protein